VIFIADRSDTSEAIDNLSALHDEHALRSVAEAASVCERRFETEPGRQSQID